MLKLGMVTYLWGKDWDLPTLIANCEETGFEGVELRSTHAHGVEVDMNATQRAEVRARFDDSPVTCVGLGSACEYHSQDHGVVQQNIELTKKFLLLSHDVGASGVKVRPNGLNRGEAPETTVARIGEALHECGKYAADYDQEIRVEVHGRDTKRPEIMRQIIDAADHPRVHVCWNSNPGETVEGSLKSAFNALRGAFGSTLHIHDLYDENYPYRELFALLRETGYEGWCLSESPATVDPLKVMKYYRALWEEMIRE